MYPFSWQKIFEIVAIPEREDIRDVIYIRDGRKISQDLKKGAVIGTSSIRRAAMLKL